MINGKDIVWLSNRIVSLLMKLEYIQSCHRCQTEIQRETQRLQLVINQQVEQTKMSSFSYCSDEINIPKGHDQDQDHDDCLHESIGTNFLATSC